MSFIQEFRAFAVKGNVMDMAVGVIIGGAFGKIVSSLVDNIFTPVIAAVTSGKKFDDSFQVKLGSGEDAATLKFGAFLQTTIDFIIIAFCIFLLVKMVNRARELFEAEAEAKAKVEEKVAPPPVVPSEEVQLLREIRDSLKTGS